MAHAAPHRKSLAPMLLVLVLVACSVGSPGQVATSTAVPEGAPILDATGTANTQPPPVEASPQTPGGGGQAYYDTGSPLLTEIYISPTGDDNNSGESRSAPLQTIGAAWSRIPTGTLTGTGYRINFLPGVYPCEGDCVNFFSDRSGTHDFPIILQAADGPGTATLRGGLNLYNVRYLYLVELDLWAGSEAGAASGNNTLHIELGEHILMRRLRVRGPQNCITDLCNDMQEILKINQAQYIYLEQSDLSGTYQTVLDYFAVQHGHILDNHIHHAGGRCAYLKGGSAYIVVAGNEFDDCREAGFQAGEGANLAFMQSPWLHYEAYDLKVFNNVIHDIYGAGLSVAGGYNILMAFNTLYRVGLDDEVGRTWPLVQVIHGARSCIPADEFGGDAGTQARCQEQLDAGGWGTAALGYENGGDWIPARNVFIMNNIFYNPPGTGTHYVQFVINGAITPAAHSANIPNPSSVDANLVIRGNLIWNQPLEGGALIGDNNGSGNLGCQAGNPTCNPAQLQAENSINASEPLLRDPAHGDYRPAAGSPVFSLPAVEMPAFTWDDAPQPPLAPPGILPNSVPRDRDGAPRSPGGPTGAYTQSQSAGLLFLPCLVRG